MKMKETEDRDIFDIVISSTALRRFYPVYGKYKEALLYLFFGGLTFFLAIGIFVLLEQLTSLDVLLTNIISWLSGVTFSFFTTKKWVFRVQSSGIKALIQQMTSFYTARLMTLILQELLLYIFISMLGCSSILVKICTEVINIILNYLVSKFIIFKK